MICDHVPLGELSLKALKEGLDHGKEMEGDVDTILSDYEGKINEQLQWQIDQLPKLIKKIKSTYDKADEEFAETKKACDLANVLADIEFDDKDDEEDAQKDAEKLLEDAEKFIEKGDKELLDVEFLLFEVKDIKGAVVAADMKYDFKLREAELKDELDAQKEILKKELDEMDEVMDQLKDELKESKSYMNEQKLMEEEAKLETLILRERARQEELEENFKFYTDDMKDEEKYLQTMMELTFEMEYAHTQEGNVSQV